MDSDFYGLTEQPRLTSTLRFLSRVSQTLASSFDFAQNLSRIATLVVPEFADGFAVQMVDSDGVHTTPVTLGIVCAFDEPATNLVKDFQLFAHDRVLGRMRISRSASERTLDLVDREMFGDLAARVAGTIETAQIFAREHHVADTLQRALLPDRLPSGKRQTFSAAYLPGAEEAIVGGDWYDVFDLADGRIAFSIGDVAGHGLRAAVVMGEVRQAFRASALNPKSPSLVLERANTILNMRSNPVMVTALFGIVDEATSTVTYASAGHPAPILVTRNGSTQVLPADGIPLGIETHIEARDWTFTIPPGSILTLYTDGLIEHSRDVLAGEEELIDALRAEIFSPSADPAHGIVDRVFEHRKNTDDVATLALAVPNQDVDRFAFDFTALPLAIPILREALGDYLKQFKLSEDQHFAILLAVGEAAANAVEHAYQHNAGLIRVRANAFGERLNITVQDGGRWKPAEISEERGRGLRLMRALMHSVEIRTGQADTTVRLSLRMHDPESSAAS